MEEQINITEKGQKAKISISIDQEVLDEIDKSVLEGKFRNRSHAFEYSFKLNFNELKGGMKKNE